MPLNLYSFTIPLNIETKPPPPPRLQTLKLLEAPIEAILDCETEVTFE